MIYLDHCATTPLDPGVAEAMREAGGALTGNPSSVHGPGRAARAILSESRRTIAGLMGAAPGEIVFTASGSEANNLALKGTALRDPAGVFHLVVSSFEHLSVLDAARYLGERFNWMRLTEVRPRGDGTVDPAEIEAACMGGASLVSVMTVNNELGTIQPVAEIAEIAHGAGALMHTDAVQAAGRLSLNPAAMGVDLMSLSAHKLYGPAGAGLLYVRAGTQIDALTHGGHQEKGRRAGTEDVTGIAGFARAMELADERREADGRRAGELETIFLGELRRLGVDFEINGGAADKVPGVMNLSLRGLESHDLVVGLDLEGVAISAGSACSSGVIEPSHVLRSLGLDEARVRSGIRVSAGRHTTPDDMKEAAARLARVAANLKAETSSAITGTP